MKKITQLHDGIVGALILVTLVLAVKVDMHWIYVPGAISLLMVSSMFTGFCPVYFVLNKLPPADKPAT